MKKHYPVLAVCLVLLSLLPRGIALENYALSQKTVEGHVTYHFTDAGRRMEFRLAPDIGNLGYALKVNGKDVFVPVESLTRYLEERKFGYGNPFLAPFANRMAPDHYYFQGRKYLLNDALGNFRRDQFKQAIHGLLAFDRRWTVIKSGASATEGAYVTSRLEFYKHPDLMAQFPFAHEIDMTYRLKDGKLENTTEIRNLGQAAMPVHIGYHPYFRVDGPRDEWTLSLGTTKHWILNRQLVPTGEQEPLSQYSPSGRSFPLGGRLVDDIFSDFERDANGLGRIVMKGQSQTVEVVYGRDYDFGVVYAPLNQAFFCIEPMTGPTNGFNLNHEGKFPGLIVVEPGKSKKLSYWIVPGGF